MRCTFPHLSIHTDILSIDAANLPGTPEVVVVTLLDEESMSAEYISRIKENRQYYANKHGAYS